VPQLIFSLHSGQTPGQQRLGTRTTRMLEVDLFDLERELAQNNHAVFERLGLSVAVEPQDEVDVELAKVVSGSETSRVARLIPERASLIGKLMGRSRSWEKCLADIVGGVSELRSFDMTTDEAKAAFKDGTWKENLEPVSVTRCGEPGNPWQELSNRQFPFPAALMFDALFEKGAEPNISPPYRDLSTWLWNDVDEMGTVQWTVDRLGWSPWPGSWMEHQYNAAKYAKRRPSEDPLDFLSEVCAPQLDDPDLPGPFRDVYARVMDVRGTRQMEFELLVQRVPRQMSLKW